jgi:hypothetical protein
MVKKGARRQADGPVQLFEAGSPGRSRGWRDTSIVPRSEERRHHLLGDLRRLPRTIEVHVTARIEEDRPALGPEPDPPTALVHESVMVAAQQQPIVEARLAAVSPVHDVMSLGESSSAAGEAASAVTNLQPAAQWPRDRACLPSQREDGAVGHLSNSDHARIARDAPRRFM